MKKVLVVLLVAVFCMSVFAGCGGNDTGTDDPGQGNVQTQSPRTQDGATSDPAATVQPLDLSGMQPDEYLNFDAGTNTVLGFKEGIANVIELVIPAEINGSAVKIIGEDAFKEVGLQKVTLPDSLTTIMAGGFQRNEIVEMAIPENVTVIGDSAFEGNSLESINIPDGVTILSNAVLRNNNLTSIILPDGITNIGRGALQKNQLTEIIIPGSVGTIESLAFQLNDLEKVTLNEGIEHINGYAFDRNKIVSITIPASVKSIGYPSEGQGPQSYYEKFTFTGNPITEITFLAAGVDLNTFIISENNHLKNAYEEGGAGTYTGSQHGKWEKSN